MAMNPEIKAKWVAALRSGEYKQGKAYLRTAEDSFCCLGVLCNLHAQSHPRIAAKQKNRGEYMGCFSLPHDRVLRWAGLDLDADVSIDGERCELYAHNDRGRTFSEIADAIEAQL